MARKGTIDTVRGIGILAVIVVHTGQSASPDPGVAVGTFARKFLDFTNTGMYGVQVFFCISGYLLFMLYRDTTVSTSSYWVRRIARLWPLWAAFVLLGLAVPFFRPELIQESYLITAVLSLAFLGWLFAPQISNFPNGGWSILAEMGHYLLFWPMRRLSPILLVSTIAIGYMLKDAVDLLRQLDQPALSQWFLDGLWELNLWNTWPYFLIGGIAYLLTTSPDSRRQVMTSLGTPMGLVITFISFAYLEINDQMPAIGSVACLVIVAFLADYLPKLSSGIRSIGKVSYFMYFAHFYVLYVCSTALRHFYRSALGPDAAPEPVLYFFVLLAAAVSISWGLGQISWRYFESPISRKAQLFHAQRSKKTLSNTS